MTLFSRKVLAAGLSLLLPLLVPAIAHADVEHVVAKGHTLQAIANRYHVSVRSIVVRNNIRNPKGLQLGQVLVIPGVGDKKKDGASSNGKTKTDAKGKPTDRYAARSKEPGVVRACSER